MHNGTCQSSSFGALKLLAVKVIAALIQRHLVELPEHCDFTLMIGTPACFTNVGMI